MHAAESAGYVIRLEHIQVAIDKATADERLNLEPLVDAVRELDELERSTPERVAKAQADAGIEKRPLSKAAGEAIATSSDAAREIDRLLTRKCNRADSAVAVLKEILTIAKQNMKSANWLDNATPDDDPTKAIYSELYWKRREFVSILRELIA
ncbi:MAG: hypothetical protein QNJ05_05375 [Woeseiaceae bacterium]|nr:hypothetical protein [Woeseiaceae bacterium]